VPLLSSDSDNSDQPATRRFCHSSLSELRQHHQRRSERADSFVALQKDLCPTSKRFVEIRRISVPRRCVLACLLFLLVLVPRAFAQHPPAQDNPSGDKATRSRFEPNCLKSESGFCTVCGIDVALSSTVSSKTKTPLLLCRNMKPGHAKLAMKTHAEPVTPGLWEVEFGLGYRTSAREECPHQFIASNNPTRDPAYEIGPLSIESVIPRDGMIQALVCVGLSSARAGGEGKETSASLKISTLTVVSR
jgi:hypothetical protein